MAFAPVFLKKIMITVDWKNSWSIIKVKLQKEFPQLTDVDVALLKDENEESFLSNLEHKLGMSRNELLGLFAKYRVEQYQNFL